MYVKVYINNLLMNITLDYLQYIKDGTADLLMIISSPQKGHITNVIMYLILL